MIKDDLASTWSIGPGREVNISLHSGNFVSVLPLLSRNTANFRFADFAGNEAPLLLHRD
jgi:hypothetical protein